MIWLSLNVRQMSVFVRGYCSAIIDNEEPEAKLLFKQRINYLVLHPSISRRNLSICGYLRY
jgi:hypothetical protein